LEGKQLTESHVSVLFYSMTVVNALERCYLIFFYFIESHRYFHLSKTEVF